VVLATKKRAPHLFTHLFTHQVRKFGELQLGEEGRERCIAQCWIFSIVWSFILALYHESILRKFCWVFSPMRVSQDKYCVFCDGVSLSDPTYAIVI
jgi:hypothetical protein